MAKQMVEVDVPDGFEFVRIGVPKAGEGFICIDRCGACMGGIRPGDERDRPYDVRVIVREAWVWPAGINAEWLAVETEHGRVLFFDTEPTLGSDGYFRSPSCGVSILDRRHVTFELPPEANAKRRRTQ
jgi:hypothetical protein